MSWDCWCACGDGAGSSAWAGLAGSGGRKSCQGPLDQTENKCKQKPSVYRQGKTHCLGDLKHQSRNSVVFLLQLWFDLPVYIKKFLWRCAVTWLLCFRYLTVTVVLGIIVLVLYMSGKKYVNIWDHGLFFFKTYLYFLCFSTLPSFMRTTNMWNLVLKQHFLVTY